MAKKTIKVLRPRPKHFNSADLHQAATRLGILSFGYSPIPAWLHYVADKMAKAEAEDARETAQALR